VVLLGRPWWQGRSASSAAFMCSRSSRPAVVARGNRCVATAPSSGVDAGVVHGVVASSSSFAGRHRGGGGCCGWSLGDVSSVLKGASLRWLSAVHSASHRTLRLEVSRSHLLQLFRRGASPTALAQVASSPALVRRPSSEARRHPGEGRGPDRVQGLQC
jgi:hypothetical protein